MFEEIKTTTFHYSQEKYWRFKNIVTSQRKTVKEVASQLLDRVIEDYEDEQMRDEIIGQLKKSGWQVWVTVKRRLGLDGASSFDQQ